MNKRFNLDFAIKAVTTDESKPFEFTGIATSSFLDSDGDELDMNEFDWERFDANPVLLMNHNTDKVIGKCTKRTLVNNSWLYQFQLSKSAENIAELIREKILRGLSISFGYLDKIVYEISVTPLPANPKTLIQSYKALKGNTNMKPVQPPMITTQKYTGVYSLQNLIKAQIEGTTSFEHEISQELKSHHPHLAMNQGIAIPDDVNIKYYNKLNQKSSGTTTGGADNLIPLLGTESRDELFSRTGDALTEQMLFDQIPNVTKISAREKTVTIPRQLSQSSSEYTAIDANFHDSSDPSFDTQDLSPKLVTSKAVLQLSAIFTTSPNLGTTGFIGSELNRAMAQTINTKFLIGDNGVTATEPNGIFTLAQASSLAASIPLDATAKAQLITVPAEVEEYTGNPVGGLFILHPKFIDALMTTLAFTGSTEAAHQDGSNTIAGTPYIRAPWLTVDTTADPDNSPGLYISDPSTIVVAEWFGRSMLINNLGDQFYNNSSVGVRVHAFNDLALIDPLLLRSFLTNVA